MSGSSKGATEAKSAPHEDHAAKPDSPTDISKRSWKYVLGRTVREFMKDQCTDIAAALTYWAVLALFPALIAVLSVISLTGETQRTVDTMLDLVESLGSADIAETLEPVINQIASSTGAGVGLIVGIGAALWTASGFTNAFSRAMNRMYEVEEGRPIWKLRPIMLLITAVLLSLAALVLVALVLTGPAAEAVGDVFGLSATAVTVWNIAKWPVILLIVVVMVAVLYWATPNLKQPKFRWLSVGAGVAILVWILASVGFGFYVANFSNYEATYGALAGVIIFLLWVWITNLALLFGAELDAELERGRQLQAGIVAEEKVQLPPRDTSKIEKDEEKRQQDIDDGRDIRYAHTRERFEHVKPGPQDTSTKEQS